MGCAVVDSHAFKALNILERQLAILRSSGDYDAARRNTASTVDLNCIGPFAARQLYGSACNQHLGSKLLCLCIGASGKLLSRDAGRKAKIVLDFGTRARLSARRHGLDHKNV